jgi:hypothetical protein
VRTLVFMGPDRALLIFWGLFGDVPRAGILAPMVARAEGSNAAQDAPDHGGDRQLAANEVVVLGQVVGGVLLTQPVVDVLVHGWQRVLVLEIGAGMNTSPADPPMVSMEGCPQSSHRPRSSLAHFAKRPLSPDAGPHLSDAARVLMLDGCCPCGHRARRWLWRADV